jgi:squalene-associated FAD-dependent desaturase
LKRVAVIGAGWSGLAAAVRLSSAGLPVTVFEASRQLGGRARRVSIEGQHLDNGQHILIGAYRSTLDLLRELGSDPDRVLLRQPLDLRYADGFRMHAPRLPAPLHLAWALAGARGLSWTERLGAARMMQALKAARFQLPDPMSVGELLVQHRQSDATTRHLWEPLCVSALNTPVASASARVFAAVLRDSLAGSRSDSDLLIPCTDLGDLLPEPAARHIEQHHGHIRLGAPVRSIHHAADGAAYRIDEEAEAYSHVILATAPQHAAALLAHPALSATRALIEALRYQPIVTCYLQYPALTRLPCPMLGLTGTVQWLFDRGQLGGQSGLLAAVISAEGRHRELDQQALAAHVHAEILDQAMPGLPAPEWSRVITEKRATYACDAGVRRPAMQTALPGLLLAGDYLDCDYPATLETAVRQGLAAAAAILD